MRLKVVNTVRDITTLSNKKYIVKHDHALVFDMDTAKKAVIDICRNLKLNPNEFVVINQETGKRVRFNHPNPACFTD